MLDMRKSIVIILLAGITSLCGCVERMLIVRTDPPGGTVVVNGQELGPAPARLNFETYGTFEVIVSYPNMERKRTAVPVAAPWFEQFPIDLFTELVWPWTLRDEHDVTIALESAENIESGLNTRETEMRERVERSLRD